jgi:hypothetical protein
MLYLAIYLNGDEDAYKIFDKQILYFISIIGISDIRIYDALTH